MDLKLNSTKKWSHWGDLNSRPSHYQWDAIPLSHSGDRRATDESDLTATAWDKENLYSTFVRNVFTKKFY